MDAQTNKLLLTGYLTEPELARELKRSRRTVIRWRVERKGPPVTYVGRTPLYRMDAAVAWLRSQETRAIRRINQRNK